MSVDRPRLGGALRTVYRLGPEQVRASWTVGINGFHGVLKKRDDDMWVFECKHAHTSRAEALACAREVRSFG